MSPDQRCIHRNLLRREFTYFAERCFRYLNSGAQFVPGWHIDVVANWMALCEEEGQRMIINLPPRHLKSILGSVALPAWLLGRNPSMEIMCASYGRDLAEKFSVQCRSVMESPWYRATFRTRLKRSRLRELVTTANGGRFATSVDGEATGRGADLIIIDDPLKPDEALADTTRTNVNDWFANTIYSRLNSKQDGRILLIMQRLHEDDLAGHLLAKGGWSHLALPAVAETAVSYDYTLFDDEHTYSRPVGEALHPAREPLEVLAEIRSTIGEYHFAGQYQQTPAPLDGGLVKAAWFQSYGPAELPDRFDMVLQSWDTANTPSELSDYSVCTTWGVAGNHIYLLHVLRKKLDYPNLKRAVLEQAALHRATVVLIEEKASGVQLIQELKEDRLPGVTAYKPEGLNKLMRMNAQTGVIENGFVHLPRTAEWREAYLHEMTTFPKGRHDDQVDSTSQALHWINMGRPREPGLLTYYRMKVAEMTGVTA